ncbi:MAG: NAD(P)-binding protein, partial [Rhizobiales bacterium]|nr:NAD(P)-binding protein [Hyphomicrobiales bacterium]
MKRAHVIGAGLAGLSSALQLLDRGYQISLYEA